MDENILYKETRRILMFVLNLIHIFFRKRFRDMFKLSFPMIVVNEGIKNDMIFIVQKKREIQKNAINCLKAMQCNNTNIKQQHNA